ncbi:MAG: DUF6029 family protein [Bacteroidota bacterium]
MKKSAILFFVLCASLRVFGQGTLTGDFQTNMNFFQKDTAIGASGNPLYENVLSGGEGWLTLRYNVNGFTFFLRGDVFNNSNLKNPTSPMTDFGVGAWNITKEINDLTISVGTIYDQIGSGILFRSYEDRGLLIDNALVGIELKYKLGDKIMMKGFTGQQRNNNFVNNVRYGPVIKGFNAEGDYDIGKAHIIPGIGVLNRTLDEASMQSVASTINAQPIDTRFLPKYNMYAFTAYNTLTYKNFSWYAEASYKTHEAIKETRPYIGPMLYNALVDRPGNIQYTSINYGMKGIALSVSGKRTDNYVMRTSPNEVLLNGMLNWQPVVAVLRPQRLISRYSPPSQDISEMAATANLLVSPNDATTFTFTYSQSNTLDDRKLYREAYAEGIYQGMDKWIFEGGIQYLEYNIALYQNRPSPMQFAITPFAEVTYRIDEKRSIRTEFQYMHAKYDYGSWAFALIEYNIAPKWSISLSDMFNIVPNTGSDNLRYRDPGNHYYNFFAAYTKGPNRFTLAYVKQVDGINCTGGVCRYEPAFSGVKATVTSSF